jgi:hypothetical protein
MNGLLADRRFTPCLMLCHFSPPKKHVVLRRRLREANFQSVASLSREGLGISFHGPVQRRIALKRTIDLIE